MALKISNRKIVQRFSYQYTTPCLVLLPHPLNMYEVTNRMEDAAMQYYYGNQMPLRVLDEAEF